MPGYRCILGCKQTGSALHVFPNYNIFPERFKLWVSIVGGKLETPSDFENYKKKRICDIHFKEGHKTRNHRLSAIAVPCLYLPDKLLPPCLETADQSGPSASARNLSVLSVPVIFSPEENSNPRDNVSSASLPLPGSASATLHYDHDYCIPPLSNWDTETDTQMSSDLFMPTGAQITHKIAAPKLCNPDPKKRQNRAAMYLNEFRTRQRQIKNLRCEIFRLRKRGQTFKRRLANASKISYSKSLATVTNKMTLPAKIFTLMQFRETSKKAKGRRFTTEEKILSLSLYKRSPKCYALLSKCFTLPSARCLKNLLARIKIKPGINKQIFEKLKQSVDDMNEDDRLCTLIFDEMSVTPQLHYSAATDTLKGLTTIGKKGIADHALTFLVRGIRKNYKQPVAYYFTHKMNKMELKATIKEVVTHVQATGFKIVATVCDQSTTNVGAIESLIADAKAVFLRKGLEWKNDVVIIDGKKIIPLYDAPHLIKCLRNNLMTKDLKYVDYQDNEKEKQVKWAFFQQLYEADKSYGELRILHKITEEHINPEKINKMKVKSATQLFSHSVAVAAKHLVDGGKLDPECLQITPLALMLDKLFDSLNSHTFQPASGKIYRAGVRKNSVHHQLWQEGILFLKSIKFVEKKKDGSKIRLIEKVVPSLKNFVKTRGNATCLENLTRQIFI